MFGNRDGFDDLLSSRRRGGKGGVWKIVVVVLVLAVVAGAFGYRDVAELWTADEPEVRPDVAVAAATQAVDASLSAARKPLEVEAGDADEPEFDPAQLTAVWAEGEAVEMRGELARNESVFLALQNRGLTPKAIHEVVTATGEEFNFRRSRPGDEWYAEVDAAGVVTTFEYKTSPEDIWESVRNDEGGYDVVKLDVPVERRQHLAAGKIETSLWESFDQSGAGGALAAQYIDLFAYTIDFATETQPGDEYAVVYEKVYLDGEFLRYGKVLAARFDGDAGEFYGFWHESEEDDEAGYYNENGENLRRQFLKSPLATVRITSRYGRRYHPVLKTMKMHAGVDYGAPTGTPVQAVADGRVVHAGWKGPSGKLVSIKHKGGYTTHYAHLSRISKGIKRGKKVTRKTVIGRVGSTGRSTGPHLHFGMKRHGRHINPLKVDFARGEPLKGRDRENFKKFVVEPMLEKLDAASAAAEPSIARPGEADVIEPG